jgi:Holliday junction resolvasome RuvABC endonuclease subunit
MKQTTSKTLRILSIAPSARGFGYAVVEGDLILECGAKGTKGNKNLQGMSKIEKLMTQFLPGVLVLPDVNAKGSHRAPRIKALHRQIIKLAAKQKCKVALFSGEQLRDALLGDVKGTKHEMAEMIANKYPAELAAKLPPKRRAWENEDWRMGIFDAMGLAVVFRMKRE